MNSSSSKELNLRRFILEEKLWKVILYITYPLAIYSLFNHLYGFIDMIIVAHIGNTQVGSVAILSEIQNMITAFGGGIAAGGAVLVAKNIGANQMDEAKKQASTVFFLSVLVSISIILVLVPLSQPFLILLNTPSEVIETGLGYFIVQIITTGFITINSVFIGIEKAKANTQRVLKLNIIIMTIKLILSIMFVYGLNLGIIWVAIATMISQIVLTGFAFITLFSPKNILKIRASEISVKWQDVKPILLLSLPIFLGKFIFSTGRVIINAMAALYGTLVVSAFSVAQRIGGAGAQLAIVFEEAVPTVISQNLGFNQIDRAKKVYPIAILFSLFFGIITIVYAFLFKDYIIPLIVNKDSTSEYINTVIVLFRWEVFSKLTSAVISITLSMFYGFKHTRIAMTVNFIRLFILRVPVLWALQNFTNLDFRAIGITMFVSNTGTAVVTIVLAGIFYLKMKNNITLLTTSL